MEARKERNARISKTVRFNGLRDIFALNTPSTNILLPLRNALTQETVIERRAKIRQMKHAKKDHIKDVRRPSKA